MHDGSAAFETIGIEGVAMKIEGNDASTHFNHTVLAELIARRWREDRHFFTLNGAVWGTRLEASWSQQPGNSALELHWSRRRPCVAGAEQPAPLQAKLLEGAA
jgi:hypothetical protein